jgi:AcrR family transcriptional regulator
MAVHLDGAQHTGATRRDSLREAAVARAVRQPRERASEAVQRMLAAAYELIERDAGFDINVRELLATAGVSTRAFYRHFPTKHDLMATLVEELYAEMLSSLEQVIDPDASPDVRLERWIDATLEYARDERLASRGRVFVKYEARLRTEHRELYRSTGRDLIEQVAAIVDQGVESGLFRSRDSVSDARFVVRLVLATMQDHVLEQSAPTPASSDALLAFVMGALR